MSNQPGESSHNPLEELADRLSDQLNGQPTEMEDESAGTVQGGQVNMKNSAARTVNAAIRKDFKFMGPSGIYVFLYVIGEEVIPHDEFERLYK